MTTTYIIIEERNGDELVAYRKYELAASLPDAVTIRLSPFEVEAAEIIKHSAAFTQFKRRPLAPLVHLGVGAKTVP
jgi:hypothetical protein